MAVLVRHLPEDSAVAHAVGGLEATWRLEHHLLACVYDALSVLDWHFVIANTEAGKQRPPEPKPLPRPGITVSGEGDHAHLGNTEHLDMAEVRAYLDRFKPPPEE